MGNFWLFLLPLGVILGFSRLVGAAFLRIGQPRVAGEMAAGFALGPAVFGALAPPAFR
jgi:Kef-type K+ transport system membrane component KefB